MDKHTTLGIVIANVHGCSIPNSWLMPGWNNIQCVNYPASVSLPKSKNIFVDTVQGRSRRSGRTTFSARKIYLYYSSHSASAGLS